MSSTQVRLHPLTKSYLDLLVAKINKARSKHSKKPLTMDDVIFLALEQVTVDMGVSK